MSDSYSIKKITGLTANESSNDADLFVLGNNGTDTLRKVTFANLASWVKTKISALTSSDIVNNATTNNSSKVASAAVAKTLQDQLNLLKPRSIATGSHTFTTTDWEYTGVYFTLGTGYHVVWITPGWASGRPVGAALHTSSSGSDVGYFTVKWELDPTGSMTPAFVLQGGTYYLFIKRGSTGTNTSYVNGFTLPS